MGQTLIHTLQTTFTHAFQAAKRLKTTLLHPFGRAFRAVMPKSLMVRSLLIIVTPLIVLQIITATVFFDRHWEAMRWRLNSAVASEIQLMAEILDRVEDSQSRDRFFDLAARQLQLDAAIIPREAELIAPPPPESGSEEDFVTRELERVIGDKLPWPYYVTNFDDRTLVLYANVPDGTLEILIPRKRLFSTTIYVFILWMTASSVILFAVAWLFMRNQVRPILRLAKAADALGKGHDVENFPNRGASEVRQAGLAFIRMRERLRRQIAQRTEMLAGVSHDLRTPLTRMRLQLAFMEGSEGAADLGEDIAEMERLIEGYLAFAESEGTEKAISLVVNDLVDAVVGRLRRGGAMIDLHAEQPLLVLLKPHATERLLNNIIGNAVRYADHVSVRMGVRSHHLEILVDDDGPGIPPDRREDVFRAFVRLETSRNPRTGGTGLGLTIARDLARSMGGDIGLESSPMGGLRARIRFPL